MLNACPVCGNERAQFSMRDRTATTYVECPQCGDYGITRECIDDLPGCEETDPSVRRKIRRYLREKRGVGNVLLTSGAIPQDRAPGRLILDLRSAMGLHWDEGSPLQKFDSILLSLAQSTEKFGHVFNANDDRWIVPVMDDEEAKAIINALAIEGYVQTHHGQHSDEADWYISLTPAGLRRADDLRRRSKEEGVIVFVAACFTEDLTPARNTIERIVREWGYEPKMVDRVAGDQLIELKVYELIRASRFVVADLTCHRQSVYYEVGFAHGLGLEVVYTCKETDMGDLHFDLAHRPILKWTDEQQLAEVLALHLRQAFPRGPIV